MKRWLLLLKVLATVGLMAFLLSRIDLAGLLRTLRSADLLALVAAALAFTIQPGLSAWRWNLALAALLRPIGFGQVLRIYWISIFFNQFLPASVGGDAVRVWLLHRSGYDLRANVLSILVDRIVMLATLMLLVVASQPFVLAKVHVPQALTNPYLLGGLAASAAAAAGLLWFSRRRLLRLPPLQRLAERLSGGSDLRWNVRQLGALVPVAVLSYLPFGVALWLICHALSLPIELLVACLVTPAAILSATLPVSIGGWGVREGALTGLLLLNGAPLEPAVSAALLFGIGGLVSCLPGGVAFLLERRAKRLPPRRQMADLRIGEPETNR